MEAARCDEIIDCLDDLISLTVLEWKEEDPARKEKLKDRLKNQEFPRVLGFLERKLQENGGKHMVGQSVSSS